MDRMRSIAIVFCFGITVTMSLAKAEEVTPRANFGPRSLPVAAQAPDAAGHEAEFPVVQDHALPTGRTQQSESLRLVRNNRQNSSTAGSEVSQPQRGVGANLGTLLGSLVCVVVVILGVAKLFLRKNPFAVPGLPRNAIEVLGRRTVDPRNSVYLVRVGGKVLLLGASSNGLAPLGEITDPIEVATLVNVSRATDPQEAGLADWFNRFTGRKPPTDTRSFGDRLGEQLFQDSEKNDLRLSNLSTRLPSEGRHGL